MKKYKFSLIICTIEKIDPLNALLESLSKQTYNYFEVIIVDQNKDNRLADIIYKFENRLNIIHVKSEKGLSKARNVGLKYITGDIVGFPDDDCLYPPELLDNLNNAFNDLKYDVLSIRMKNSFKNGRKIQNNIKSQEVTKSKVLKLMASISMFYRVECVKKIGDFDEGLGLGTHTIYQGGEDYDYPLRALALGYKIYYINYITVLHPWDDDQIDKNKKLESRSYYGGAAEMYVLNKHSFGYIFKLSRILRRISIIIYYLLKLNFYKAKLSFMILKGMILNFNVAVK